MTAYPGARTLAVGALLGGLVLCLGVPARGQEDFLDRADQALAFGLAGDQVRAHLSGTLDLEGYSVSEPMPALVFKEGDSFLVPRLSLFLDVQAGAYVYAFVQARADDGFDPGDDGRHVRPDEYVVRLTPWADGRLNLQAGKFATVVGNWTPRHGSWENPFITAPLPYENETGIWGNVAARSAGQLLFWAGLAPGPSRGGQFPDKYNNVPVIWGPSYASGASAFGDVGKLLYAVEVKNAALASQPEAWTPGGSGWRNPAYSGRVALVPNEMWTVGLSASSGTYLQPEAAASLPPGRSLGRYTEGLVGQDVSFAWHHFQAWAEAFEARFAIPGVGNANTQAYYIEGKYKFTPQLFGSLRWNQQAFSGIALPSGGSARWGRNVWRIDAAPAYRVTPHLQLKLQYSLEHQDADAGAYSRLLAVQVTSRF